MVPELQVIVEDDGLAPKPSFCATGLVLAAPETLASNTRSFNENRGSSNFAEPEPIDLNDSPIPIPIEAIPVPVSVRAAPVPKAD